jgi:hypothetical protein
VTVDFIFGQLIDHTAREPVWFGTNEDAEDLVEAGRVSVAIN